MSWTGGVPRRTLLSTLGLPGTSVELNEFGERVDLGQLFGVIRSHVNRSHDAQEVGDLFAQCPNSLRYTYWQLAESFIAADHSGYYLVGQEDHLFFHVMILEWLKTAFLSPSTVPVPKPGYFARLFRNLKPPRKPHVFDDSLYRKLFLMLEGLDSIGVVPGLRNGYDSWIQNNKKKMYKEQLGGGLIAALPFSVGLLDELLEKVLEYSWESLLIDGVKDALRRGWRTRTRRRDERGPVVPDPPVRVLAGAVGAGSAAAAGPHPHIARRHQGRGRGQTPARPHPGDQSQNPAHGGGGVVRRRSPVHGGDVDRHRAPAHGGGDIDRHRAPAYGGGDVDRRRAPAHGGGGGDRRRAPAHGGGGGVRRRAPAYGGGDIDRRRAVAHGGGGGVRRRTAGGGDQGRTSAHGGGARILYVSSDDDSDVVLIRVDKRKRDEQNEGAILPPNKRRKLS